MFWDVKIITAPSSDTDLSLVVTFDQDKYFINCGEGTQRACTQRGVGFKKMDGILLTNSGSGVGAGLPGVLMSAADSGVPGVKIAGPEDALQYLVSCRTFVQREKFSVNWLPHPEDPSKPIHHPNHLSIRAIPLSSTVAPPSFPTPRQDWEWRDVDLELDSLSPDQLAGWRRTVLADMFKKDGNLSGQAKGANTNDTSPANDPKSNGGESVSSMKVINPPLPSTSATPDGHVPKPIRQFHPARMHIPQPIPHPSFSSTSGSAGTSDPDLRYAYILQAPPVRGKFDIKKAEALGVPKGPSRGQLIQGGSIEVDDGAGGKKVIRSEDVLGETQDGGAFIMVDITAAHLPRLLDDPAFKEYQSIESTGKPEKQARLVVHRITDEVMRDERYQAWARAFGKDTPHLVANIDRWTDSVTFSSSARNILKLGLLDDKLFKPISVEDLGQTDGPAVEPFIDLKPYHTTRIFPPSPPVIEPAVKGDPGYPAKEELEQAKEMVLQEMPEHAQLVRDALAKTMEVDEDMATGDDHGMVVTPLGTGSAIPSKYRNVSATVVEIPDFGNILLDAGEGTLGQLKRRYGSNLWTDILSKTKILYISHMHADHHLGVRRILEERMKHDPTETLYLVAPSFIALHLIENGMHLDDPANKLCYIDNYHLVDGIRTDTRSPSRTPSPERAEGRFEGVTEGKPRRKSPRQIAVQRTRECLRELDLECLHAPEVEHRGRAYGLAITHRSGWKIAYSGDTMPCDSLVEAGQDATLLIHEATLEDENAAMAVIKGHSTFGQAVDIGRRMKAKYVLLNHFSQRYPKLPRVQPVPVSEQDDATRSNPKVALAFDLMTLPLKSFDKVAGYTDAMEVLFKEEEKEDVDLDGSGETESGGKQPKNGKTPKGKNEKNTNGNGPTELSNSQRRKMERKQQWETKKTPGGASSPVAGEKRQSGPKDDVDMERGTVKRTKSENVILPKSENVVLPSESTS